MPATPKVFISYSHDSDAHKVRVLEFADRLRHAGGVEAIIDRYVEPFPPEGWPAWCWGQIDEADFVLMVCTEVYHRRVTNKEEAGKGHGVCWEAPIIFQLLYEEGSVSAAAARRPGLGWRGSAPAALFGFGRGSAAQGAGGGADRSDSARARLQLRLRRRLARPHPPAACAPGPLPLASGRGGYAAAA